MTNCSVSPSERASIAYVSPCFITNAEKMIAELESPYILIHEKKLSGLQTMLPPLEAVAHGHDGAGRCTPPQRGVDDGAAAKAAVDREMVRRNRGHCTPKSA